MKLTRNIPPRAWISLVVINCLASLTWAVLREGTDSPQPPSFTPVPHFNVNIPQKALLKNYVTVSVEAAPGTTCKLTFVPPSGVIREMDTTADESGQCVWRWKLEEEVGKGDGRLIFTLNGVSDTHFMEIRSAF